MRHGRGRGPRHRREPDERRCFGAHGWRLASSPRPPPGRSTRLVGRSRRQRHTADEEGRGFSRGRFGARPRSAGHGRAGDERPGDHGAARHGAGLGRVPGRGLRERHIGRCNLTEQRATATKKQHNPPDNERAGGPKRRSASDPCACHPVDLVVDHVDDEHHDEHDRRRAERRRHRAERGAPQHRAERCRHRAEHAGPQHQAERQLRNELMAPGDDTPSVRARARVALVFWLGVGAFLTWSIAFFLAQLQRGPRRPFSLVGIGVAAVVLGAWVVHSARLVLGRRRRAISAGRSSAEHGGSRPPLETETPGDCPERSGAEGRATPASSARWALAHLDAERTTEAVPEVLLVRVGDEGIELLLREPVEVPPSGFQLLDAGWGLRPVGDATAATPEAVPDGDGEAGAAEVVELGSDADGTYFAPGGTAVVTADGRHDLADGAGPAILVVREPHGIVIEPFGLRLSPPGQDQSLARAGEQVEDSGEAALRVVEDLSPGNEPDGPLVAAGRVEVRILREDPDLVGELLVPPSAPAVEFVAYLATHDHRATTARLRDCLGTAKSLTSRSSKTVWSAASDARRALGEGLLPPSSGTQPYVLSNEVSCDWGRFQALCTRAQASEDPAEARRALIEACSLVEGVPGLSSRRFTWLDEEGLLSEMTSAITAAAQRLAELELEALEEGDGSREVARLAITTWRLLSPSAPGLSEVEQRLELVRR